MNKSLIVSLLSIIGLISGGFYGYQQMYPQEQTFLKAHSAVKQVSTNKAPAAIGPYSQGTIQPNLGLVYASGQIGLNPKTGEMAKSIETQTIQALENAKAVLEAAGSNLDNVLKATVFLKNMDDFKVMNEQYAKFFGNVLPARSCVEVSRLPKPDALVEIELFATNQ